jgi:hypothetical protein
MDDRHLASKEKSETKHGWKPHSHWETIGASKYGNHIHMGKPYVQNMQTNLFFKKRNWR